MAQSSIEWTEIRGTPPQAATRFQQVVNIVMLK